MFNIQNLVGDDKCFETVRNMRWEDKISCPDCGSGNIIRFGYDETQPERRKYHCKNCQRYFDDLTNTIFVGHHQPLKTWILCLYLMGLNLSNQQIAEKLALNKDDAQRMTEQLRQGIVEKKAENILESEVEFDEVYIGAGHKGYPKKVFQKGRKSRRLKGQEVVEL